MLSGLLNGKVSFIPDPPNLSAENFLLIDVTTQRVLAEKNALMMQVRSFDMKLKDKIGSMVFSVGAVRESKKTIYEELFPKIKEMV